jgi:hypothetical protein
VLLFALVVLAGCQSGPAPAVEIAPPPPSADTPASAPVSEPTAPPPAPVERTSAPPAARPPAPPPSTVTLPAGTMIDLEMVDSVSSSASAVGDAASARIVQDVVVDGAVVVPAGSVLSGTVTEANPANRFAGIASLALHFDWLETPAGQRIPVDATFRAEKRGEKKKDAATIGGAAVGGAILGRILKDKDRAEGTKEGAIAGAVIGTAIAGATKGQDVEMAAGTPVQVELTVPVTVTL